MVSGRQDDVTSSSINLSAYNADGLANGAVSMNQSQFSGTVTLVDGGGENTGTTGVRSYLVTAGSYSSVRSAMYTDIDGTTTGVRVSPNQLDMFVGASGTDTTANIASFTSSYTQFYTQLILPNAPLTVTGYSAGIMTNNFGSLSTGIFSVTLGSNMTGITFSGGRTGGQYVIYVSASGGTRTIATTLTGTANRTNYTSAISVTLNTTALLTITYDGTRYLIAGSAYN